MQCKAALIPSSLLRDHSNCDIGVYIPLTEEFEFTRNKNSEFNLRALDSLNSAVLVWDKQERYEMRLNLASPAGEAAQSIELFCFVRNISPAFNLWPPAFNNICFEII